MLTFILPTQSSNHRHGNPGVCITALTAPVTGFLPHEEQQQQRDDQGEPVSPRALNHVQM